LEAADRPITVDRSLVALSPGSPGPIHIGAPRPFRPRTRVLAAPRDADPRLRLLSLTGALVAHDPPTVVHPVDAAEAADVLLSFLARHGYLEGAAKDDNGDGSGDGEP
jgi:electron transfer flavoprotein beta subunit